MIYLTMSDLINDKKINYFYKDNNIISMPGYLFVR